jgi:hypothetical protein
LLVKVFQGIQRALETFGFRTTGKGAEDSIER